MGNTEKKKMSGEAQAYQTNPPSGSCWEFKKRPELDFIKDHSDQATQNGQKKPTFK